MSSSNSIWQSILSEHLSPTSSIANFHPPTLLIAGPHSHLHSSLLRLLSDASSSSDPLSSSSYEAEIHPFALSYHSLKLNYPKFTTPNNLNIYRVANEEFLSFVPDLVGSKPLILVPLDVSLVYGTRRKVTFGDASSDEEPGQKVSDAAARRVSEGVGRPDKKTHDRRSGPYGVSVAEEISIVRLLGEWLSKIRIHFGESGSKLRVMVLLMKVDQLDVVIENLLVAKRKQTNPESSSAELFSAMSGEGRALGGGFGRDSRRDFGMSGRSGGVGGVGVGGGSFLAAMRRGSRVDEEIAILRRSILNWLEYCLRRQVKKADAALMYLSIRDGVNTRLLWTVIQKCLLGESAAAGVGRDHDDDDDDVDDLDHDDIPLLEEELRKHVQIRNQNRIFIPWGWDSRVEMRRLAFPFLVEENVEETKFEESVPRPQPEEGGGGNTRTKRRFVTSGNPFQRFLKGKKFELGMRQFSRGFDAPKKTPVLPIPESPSVGRGSSSTAPSVARCGATAQLLRDWRKIRTQRPRKRADATRSQPTSAVLPGRAVPRLAKLDPVPRSRPTRGRPPPSRRPFPVRCLYEDDLNAPPSDVPMTSSVPLDRNAMAAFFDDTLTKLDKNPTG